MRPLLEGRFDPPVRTLLYVPVALAVGLLLFFLVGLVGVVGFGASLAVGLLLGFAAALGVTGPPVLVGSEGVLPDPIQEHLPWLFFPLVLVITLLSYVALGVAYSSAGLPVAWSAVVPLALALVLAVAGSYLLVGFPSLGRYGTAAVERVPEGYWEHTPWLFFPLALVLGLVAYFLVGLAYTSSPLPELYLTQVAVGVAVVAGLGLAYLAVGFPDPPEAVRRPQQAVDEDRRPWLFFPLGLAITLVLFLVLGVAYTSAAFLPAGLGLPVTMVLAAALGFGASYALVGVPTPEEPVGSYAPEVPPAARPVAFVVTVLLVGPLLAFLAGSLLAAAEAVLPASVALVPQPFFLPLALILGYLAAFGVATLVWGVPGRWKGVPAPGLPEDARLALVLPLAILLAGLFTFLVELFTPLGLLASILIGGSAGILAALYGTGATDRLDTSDRETLLPELPETVKPLVLVPAWVGIGALLTFLLGFVGLPIAWSLVAGVSLGFAAALVLVEEPLLRAAAERRRERKARKQELQRRREELLEGSDG